MNMQLKAYKAQVKEVLEWVDTEFAFANEQMRLMIFDKALRPIWMYDHGNAVQEGRKQLAHERPSSLLEKYDDVLTPLKNGRLKKSFVKDFDRLRELMADARAEGWEYDEDRREFVKV